MADTTPIVLVVYKRETKTSDTFEGSIEGVGARATFLGYTFNQILEHTGEVLRNSPGHRLVMKREEAPYPMLLPEDIEDKLRNDLPAAIEALTVGPQRIVVGKPKALVQRGLRHGHDTLADALGDELYLRLQVRRDGSWVEDPVSGRWKPLTVDRLCGVLPVETVSPYRGAWCTVKTAKLLELAVPRFYLPRGWNESRGWITHDSLAALYAQYLKEKHDVSSQ